MRFVSLTVPAAALAGGLLLSPVASFSQATAVPGIARLPAPTGPSAVGRAEFHWTDSTRTDPFAAPLSTRREVVVFVWYPSEGRSGAEKSGYVPHLEAIAAIIGDSAMNAEFGSARSAISSGAVRSYAAENAPVKRTGRPFPVVVFSHGFGESSLMYSAQLEDLASHGYVVFGIEHPSDAFATALTPNHVVAFARAAWDSARTRPNGAVAYQLAQVPLRAADVRFVLDRIWRLGTLPGGARFAGALDLHRVGAFGHSLGGMAVANACRFDARIRACMNQDADDEGRPFDGGQTAFRIKQPFLFFATGHSIYASPRTPPPTDSALSGMKLSRAQYDSITGFYQHNQDLALAAMPGGSVRVKAEAEDFTHRTFMDLKLLQAPDPLAARRQAEYLQLIRRYVRAFFDGTLRGQPAPLLAREGAVDSLVTVEHWQR